MRTENDLRTAIRDRADRAPTAHPALVVARPTVRHTRLRTGIAIAAAAAAVAAVAMVPALLRNIDSTPKPHTVPGTAAPGARTTPLPALLADRTWVSYSGTDAVESFDTVQAQYIELRPAGDGYVVREITAFAPGLFDKSLISNPTPVTVNGAEGYFGAVLPWRNDNVSHTDPANTDPRGSKYADPVPAVVWKIGADQWAAVISSAPGEGSAAALTAIAGRVRATSAPLRTPIKIGYLPAGFKLSGVQHGGLVGPTLASSSELGFRRDAKYDYADWTVTVAPRATPTANGDPAGPQTVQIYPEVHRFAGNYVITVATQGAISVAEANQILASVTIADQADSPNDSWFTLAQALP